MTTRTTSDETQAMVERHPQSSDCVLRKETFLEDCDHLWEVNVGTFSEGLPPFTLEHSASDEHADRMLRSCSDKSGGSFDGKQLQALVLNKSTKLSKGTTSDLVKTSSITIMNEVLNLDSKSWIPLGTNLENEPISKSIFETEPPQIPSHSQNQCVDVEDLGSQKISGTNWYRLFDDGLPPAAVSRPHGPLTRTPRKSISRKRTRTTKRRRLDPEHKQYYQVRDVDVLLGRGGRANHHPGNKRYLSMKEAMQQRYLAAAKNHKATISQELVDTVHKWGGRFLQLEDGTEDSWFEILDRVARDKASQTLREINTPEKRAAKRARYAKRALK